MLRRSEYDRERVWKRVQADTKDKGLINDLRLDIWYSEQDEGGDWLLAQEREFEMICGI